jgi:hypothetical protein
VHRVRFFWTNHSREAGLISEFECRLRHASTQPVKPRREIRNPKSEAETFGLGLYEFALDFEIRVSDMNPTWFDEHKKGRFLIPALKRCAANLTTRP